MLLVLTIERYVSVCHPSHMRPALGPPRWVFLFLMFLLIHLHIKQSISHLHVMNFSHRMKKDESRKIPFISSFFNYRVTVVFIPVLTFLIYLPSLFRYEVVKCVLFADGSITYYKRDNTEFLETMFYSVSELSERGAFSHLADDYL